MKKVFYSILLFLAFSLPVAIKSMGQCSVPSGTVGVTPATYAYVIVESGTNYTFTLTPDMASTGATLYLNGAYKGAGTANGFGGYTWAPALTSGSVVNFYFLFTVGGQQQTKTYTYTVGSCGGAPSTTPTVSITSPVANTSYIAPANIVINATATAPPGSNITQVDFFANNGTSNIFIGTSNTAPYTFTWTNVPAGSYFILALASDDSSRTGSSTPVNITVGTQPSSGYCGTGTTNPTGDPDYEWKAETIGDSITMTLHPENRAVGCDFAIWNSNLGGYIMNLQPNGDLTKTVAKGTNTLITFFFTYRLGAGGPETNTSASPHSYTVDANCTVMPVILTDYSVKQLANGSVSIGWTTVTELNNNYFVLEAGTDGRIYRQMAKINAKGSGSDKQLYSYIDKEYAGGVKYYRLSQVDKDGKTTYYGTKVINSSLTSINDIYPNPLKSNSFTIRTKNAVAENVMVQIMSTSGKIIYEGKINTENNNTVKVTLSSKPAAGLYMVKANNEYFKLLVQ